MEHRDVFILEEIMEYCDKTSQTIRKNKGDFHLFVTDPDFQEVCAFRAIQIGELAGSLSDKLKESHPEIPWRNIVNFRNILTHDYGKIDNEKMWETITEDFPTLRAFCSQLIDA